MFSLVFTSGCELVVGVEEYILETIAPMGRDDQYTKHLSDENIKEIDKAIAEAEEEMKAEEEIELLEGFEEEEKLIPDEPITYSGEYDGIAITLIVDFKTTAVSGSISLGGDYYLDAAIDGTINIKDFIVTTTFSGIMGAKEAGREESWNGTINGEISDDLSTFNGEIFDDEGGGEFTASR